MYTSNRCVGVIIEVSGGSDIKLFELSKRQSSLRNDDLEGSDEILKIKRPRRRKTTNLSMPLGRKRWICYLSKKRFNEKNGNEEVKHFMSNTPRANFFRSKSPRAKKTFLQLDPCGDLKVAKWKLKISKRLWRLI